MSLTVYDDALYFGHAYRTLFDRFQHGAHSGNFMDCCLLIPIMVNGALACELFLKCLLDSPQRIHPLYKLYLSLEEQNPQIASELKEGTIHLIRNNKNNTNYSSEQFDTDLLSFSDTFKDLRYFYEANIQDNPYYLGFLDCFIAMLTSLSERKYGRRPVSIASSQPQ